MVIGNHPHWAGGDGGLQGQADLVRAGQLRVHERDPSRRRRRLGSHASSRRWRWHSSSGWAWKQVLRRVRHPPRVGLPGLRLPEPAGHEVLRRVRRPAGRHAARRGARGRGRARPAGARPVIRGEPIAATSAPGAEATTERRLVSVLFADLVGFTARSDGPTPSRSASSWRATSSCAGRSSSATAARSRSSSATP